LRTKDAVSETVSSTEVLASMVMFGLIYLLLGALWIFVLDRKIRKGPIPVAGPISSKPHGIRESATQRLGRDGLGRLEEDE
jgi:cytochrome d ubiquinol oxidase subunit I